MKKVDNYIFDFYGTLVDIWTDEHEQRLWHEMAAYYSVYGRDYAPAAFEGRGVWRAAALGLICAPSVPVMKGNLPLLPAPDFGRESTVLAANPACLAYARATLLDALAQH